MFSVRPAWARGINQRRRETGQTTPLPIGGATNIKIDRARLAELVRAAPAMHSGSRCNPSWTR